MGFRDLRSRSAYRYRVFSSTAVWSRPSVSSKQSSSAHPNWNIALWHSERVPLRMDLRGDLTPARSGITKAMIYNRPLFLVVSRLLVFELHLTDTRLLPFAQGASARTQHQKLRSLLRQQPSFLLPLVLCFIELRNSREPMVNNWKVDAQADEGGQKQTQRRDV